MLQLRSVLMLAAAVCVTSAGLAGQQPAAKSAPAAKPGAAPVIVFDTAKGSFEIETFPNDSPKSVARIVDLARKNFYRGQRVHWVQPGVVQFGDPNTRNMQRLDRWGFGGSGQKIGVKETSKRSFDRGIVGYAYRTDATPEDADSQLFILRIANPQLNGKYAALGRVTKGMDVVDKLTMNDVIKSVTVR